MHESRPVLSEGLSAEEFKRYYWLKAELANFCRAVGISPTGPKLVLQDKIMRYLVTGSIENFPEINEQMSQSPIRSRVNLDSPLSLDTLIPPDYSNCQANRAFFQSVIGPQFHFTTRFMKYCRENPGKTYGDAVEEWHAEREEKKNGQYQPQLAPQFEYNRFVRDYLANNDNKSIKDAVQAWKELKMTPRDKRL